MLRPLSWNPRHDERHAAYWPRLEAPLVSIVVCNHNYARYLPEAIASALSQSVACQVIVVDDGSTDDSRALLARVDDRVQVVLQHNGGQLAAYNTALPLCRGEVVIFLDADDTLEPQAAESAARLFDQGVVKVHWRMLLVDESGRPTGAAVPATLAEGEVLGPLERHGVLYASAPGSGNAYRRAVLDRLLPLPVDPGDKVGADFFTIYGCVAWGHVAASDAPLARYRVHRRAHTTSEPLVFGNAALGNDESDKVRRRYARLVELVARRTGGEVRYPSDFLDFSVQKSPFAAGVMAQTYRGALGSSSGALVKLLKAIWLQRSYGLVKKFGLSAWAFAVLLAPRRTGLRLARHVCDPSSRTA